MKEWTTLALIAYILVLIGGICLGLAGLLNVNLLTAIFGLFLGRLLMFIIGVAAGYLCYLFYVERFTKPANS